MMRPTSNYKLLFLVIFTLVLITDCQKFKYKTLHIGGIFPMIGGWAGGQGCLPAVEMGFEDINSQTDLLPDYNLSLVFRDSECLPGLGLNKMYELIYDNQTKVMMLSGCSSVSTFVAQAARMWNLIVDVAHNQTLENQQLAYGSSSPALSNRDRFPTFFRTHPSATLHNPTRVKMFQKWGWTRIATIQQTEEVFTSTVEDLEERVKKVGIKIDSRQSFQTNPASAVKNLKRQDARIIVGVFYEDMARMVFCEVYKQKLFGKKYVWFIIGWYPDNWYSKEDPNIDCTPEQMKEALEGHFTTEVMMLNPEQVKTVSGMTSQTFIERLDQRLPGDKSKITGYPEAPLAYDAVWALALALDKTVKELARKNLTIEDFSYSNSDIKDVIYSAMNSTKFLGVSGPVLFTATGDRIAWTQIEQMQDGAYKKIGFYDYNTDNLTWDNTEEWIAGKPPQDRMRKEKKLRVISVGLFIAMCSLAAIGIIAGTCCMIFNWVHRRRRYIHYSHPEINMVIVVGCIVCLLCIFLQGLDGNFVSETAYPLLCQARVWLLGFGFTLAYGGMFSKIWTVHRLTTSKKKSSTVQPWELYLVLGILLAIDAIVLCAWQVVDPMYRELEDFPLEEPQNQDADIMILPQLEHCSAENLNVWIGVVYSYKGLLLLFGIFLAYETRSVKMNEINDSRFVGMSIYNVVVLCIITAPVTLVISSQQDASFAFIALAIILCSFLSLGLIFVPKVMYIIKHPCEARNEQSLLTDSLLRKQDDEKYKKLCEENEELKAKIAEKEDKIKQLRQRVIMKSQQKLDDANSPHTPRSPRVPAYQNAPLSRPAKMVVIKEDSDVDKKENHVSIEPDSGHGLGEGSKNSDETVYSDTYL